MAEQKIGTILDMMEVKLDLDEGDQIVEVLILAKVSKIADGNTGICYGVSPGMDWVGQQGLLYAAIETIRIDLWQNLERGSNE